MKQEDIRPSDIWDEYLAAIKDDIKRYFNNPEDFQKVNCPGCKHDKPKKAFEKEGFNYDECINCGSLYLNPRPTEQQLNEFYEQGISGDVWAKKFYPATAEKRRPTIIRERVEYITSLNNNSDFNLVDIGCGYGIFLEELNKKYVNAKLLGVEPGKSLADVCKTRSLNVIEGFAKDIVNTHNEFFDIATCFELIEHLHDPQTLIKEIYELLKPGGKVWMTGLGADGFDVQVLYGKHKNIYPPAHINILSNKGILALMERSGYQVEIYTPGKLDVDIVKNSEYLSEINNRFVNKLFENASEEQLASFQSLLKEMKMSSHVWVIGTK